MLLILLLLFTVVVRSDKECGDGWHFSEEKFDDGSGKKDYFCYRTTKSGEYTWSEAEKECKKYGESSHLISIHSSAENRWLAKRFKKDYENQEDAGDIYKGFWLGMKRWPADGSFGTRYSGRFKQSWSDGSRVNYGRAERDAPDSGAGGPWAPGQPNYNGTPIETCVMSYAFTDYFVNPYDLTPERLYNKWNDIVCGPETVTFIPEDGRHITGTLVQGLCKKRAVPCKDGEEPKEEEKHDKKEVKKHNKKKEEKHDEGGGGGGGGWGGGDGGRGIGRGCGVGGGGGRGG
ncbi:hypothetical protein niasHS_017126 [Heterodera schachtii]|uniref:C-type lectin domain-containing protein n=1 Tax=Heterodera schachtii TaxID=97005 RepID=A0ABD2HZ37_HETSC